MALKIRGNAFPTFFVNGSVAANCLLFTYEPNSSTKKTVHKDKDRSAQHTNPIVLNQYGQPPEAMWWDGAYKLVLAPSDDTDPPASPIDTVDYYGYGEDVSIVGNNLVLNGSFEAGASVPDDWDITEYEAGTFSWDTADSVHGAKDVKFTSDGDGGGIIASDFFEVAAADVLFVSWRQKSSAADVRNVVEIVWYTAAQAQISTTTLLDDSTTNPTAWTLKTGTGTAPATACYAKIRLTGCHSSDATAGSTQFDEVYAGLVFNDSQLPDEVAFQDQANTFSGNNTFSGTNAFSDVVTFSDMIKTAKGTNIDNDDIAAGVLTLPGDGNYFHSSNTETITEVATYGVGTEITIYHTAACQYTHNATNLICPHGEDIVVKAGDVIKFVEYQSGDIVITKAPNRGGVFVNDSNGAVVVSATGITISGVITEATWESVGETGSGKDNIWTALDGIPDDVDYIKIKCVANLGASGDTANNDTLGTLYARKNGSSEAVSNTTGVQFWRVYTNASGNAYISQINEFNVPVSGKSFDAYWTWAGNSTATIQFYVTGYGYNN